MTSATPIDVTPSRRGPCRIQVEATAPTECPAAAIGLLVFTDGAVPDDLGLDSDALEGVGFTGRVGQTFTVARSAGGSLVAVGAGPRDQLTTADLRDAAAAFARSVPEHTDLALAQPDTGTVGAAAAAQAVVEGALLARYRFDLRSDRVAGPLPLTSFTVLTDQDRLADVRSGADRGAILAGAAALSRDLATCPPSLLTAERMAEAAEQIGADSGLTVEVFDRQTLQEMGCGGLLGVNRGSRDEPRMIKLSYPGTGEGGRLTLVGKGIMYDSGGISLKPSDAVHATMKNDMSGAGAILAAMSTLAELDCPTAVTGYLMCTDNMPSGSALKLGDVITLRGGKTVEVLNTDAEGRLVMADALVLATEEPTDAIVDIATLTGATMRALGVEIAGLMGNSQQLIEQVKAAAEDTDEQVWQFPLARRYRGELDSPIADLTNMGGPNAGGITAALFLEEFVGDRPWAHLDIAGTAQADRPSSWRTKGPTGFGARLLVELALNFRSPAGQDA
ncbi:leucyl aminopeptidase [Microlunatus elymi]|uniref:Probable cytosol aminopeptidase n=1 Tax=Microlunatus elymi TaxID=2596828 RepID=A0A516PZU4_9ACTN|nr:leucyl aminopeptidase [Microlunatus elymi]QDP96706.1 leucyl aminopeptidase [Microlunatus elymi]